LPALYERRRISDLEINPFPSAFISVHLGLKKSVPSFSLFTAKFLNSKVPREKPPFSGKTPYTGFAAGHYGGTNFGHAFARLNRTGTNFMETRSASDIEESTEKLLQDLKEVVRDGEELLRAGAEEIGERGAAAREKLAAALEVAKETQRRLQEKAMASAKAADTYIRSNPYQSIGIAFGVGLLLGLYASRR
jgi:ElaB/YqjD/DUF883 family membrane-anchored ribosome-binding protein